MNNDATYTFSIQLFCAIIATVVLYLLCYQTPAKNVRVQFSMSEEAVPTTKPVKTAKATTEKKAVKKDPLPKTENDAAPMAELPEKDATGYIRKFAPLAVEEMRNTGIPASISLAQGLVESRAGRSGLALTANNHFGIKCKERGKCKAGHCINFSDDIDTDYFLVFQNAYRSWKAHSALLQGARYKSLSKCGLDADCWADGLKQKGYATDPQYAKALRNIIRKYNLTQYDEQ